MTIAESTEQLEAIREKINTQLKILKISFRDIEARSSYHYNSVRKALRKGDSGWNQDVIDLAELMINEKIAEKKTANPAECSK